MCLKVSFSIKINIAGAILPANRPFLSFKQQAIRGDSDFHVLPKWACPNKVFSTDHNILCSLCLCLLYVIITGATK